MCGIVGIIGPDNNGHKIHQMLEIQSHRGPDATGSYSDAGYAALGHNRLAIIDVSKEANQPMKDDSLRFAIVFNGEIYNYVELKRELESGYSFKTNSDTEVLLAAYIKWGKDCVTHFIGMFSFAIWDSQKKELFAARDRFGVKPFYYSFYNSSLYFASEINTIFQAGIPKEKELITWSKYLAYGTYGLPNETFYKNINQLPGGHYLHYSIDNGLSVKKWYNFEDSIRNNLTHHSSKNTVEEYESILLDSVKLRFRADVNIGFNLSGGLDSSLLLALTDEIGTKFNHITAFTFTTGDNNYDELPWVKKMIAQTKHPLVDCRLNADQIPSLAAQVHKMQSGEPFAGIPTIAYSQIFKQAKSNDVTVLLDGQGMDEAWAGYNYYTNKSGHLIQGSKDSPVRPDCVNSDILNVLTKPNYPNPFDDDVKNLQHRDLFYTKIPRALRFNDKVSMMYSTELREPFLDHRLVEYAFSLPTEEKIRNGERKWLLRQLVSKFLPQEITYAPKRPLQTPQREWLKGPLKTWAIDMITTACHKWEDLLVKREVETEMQNFFNGKSDNSFYIWQWINMGFDDD